MERRNFIKKAGIGAATLLMPEFIWAGIPGESESERDRRMAWWRDARFGMFIHWGIYSIPAGVWKGKRMKTRPSEWIMEGYHIPDSEYSQLAAGFNPTKFDAKAWAKIAKAAGMKYLVITSKHHDGFCMFDSKLTNYSITNATPFKRDVIAELAKACADEGIKFGLYYSQLDWHFASRPSAVAHIPNFSRYMNYMKGQLKELLTNYGPISTLFFDGDWMPQWTEETGREVEAHIRKFQPNVIINNRLGKRPQRTHMLFYLKKAPKLRRPEVGDYATPEQLIPKKLPDCDWETCMTMNDSWGYKTGDDNWKSPTDLIHMVIDIASKGGNFLLNVGPTSEGIIPDPSVERLSDIGAWMKVNGESVYGTTAGPIQNAHWGRTTQKPGKIYLHVFEWPGGELELSGLNKEIKTAYLLSDEKQSSLPVKSSGTNAVIGLPENAPDKRASVVVLKI